MWHVGAQYCYQNNQQPASTADVLSVCLATDQVELILNCCVEQCNRDNLWELLLRCTNGGAKGHKTPWVTTKLILSKNVLFIGQIKNQVLKQCPPTWKTSTGKKVTCGRGHGYSYGKPPVAAKWYCHQLEQDFSVDKVNWKLSFQYWLMDGSATGRAFFHQKIHLQISF